MNVSRPIFAALFACGSLIAQAPCDVSGNGDFETGDFTDWQVFASAPGNITIGAGNNSQFGASIDNQNAPSAALIKNNNRGIGFVQANESITVTLDARGSAVAGGVVFVELFSEGANGVSKGEILGGAPLALDPDPQTWKTFTFTTTLGPDVANGVTLQLAGITGAVTGSMASVSFDNVSMTVDRPAASWSNYGAGWPGTNGVPSLTLDANPVLGTTVNFMLGNSSGATAIGGLLLGVQQASTPTPFGGTVLVDFFASETFASLPAAGGMSALPIPMRNELCGAILYGQLIQADPGASAGVSFSQGIQLNIGG